MGSIPTPPTIIIMIAFFVLFLYGMYLTYLGTVQDWRTPRTFPTEDIIIGLLIMVFSALVCICMMMP